MSRLLWIGWAVFVSVLVVMAVQMTCHVPRMDDWGLVIAPYFQWQDGGGFWKFLQTAGNDSRHHSAQLVHAATIKWWHWDPVVESLLCVALGGVSAAMLVDWWMRLGVKSVRVLLAGLVSVFLVLSPMQWMNWSWGIQLCYMLPISGTVAVFWVLNPKSAIGGGPSATSIGVPSLRSSCPVSFRYRDCEPQSLGTASEAAPEPFRIVESGLNRDWVLWKRVVVAVVPCWVAVFAFANGWLAVLIGGGMLVWEVWKGGWRKSERLALGIWGLSALLAAWVYVLDWPESRGITEEGLFSRVLGAPGEVVWFYLQLLGAPLGDVFVTGNRTARVAVQGWVSAGVSVVSVGVLMACGVHLWRRRRELGAGEVVPWVGLILWGLGNAAAVTLARWGAEGFGPFQARYPGFTVWYFVGLLGLLAMTRGSGWKWVMRGMLVVMGVGAGLGGLQGWRDGVKAARNGHFVEAAVAMRHVAPEPVFLETTRPWDAGNTVKWLDRLDEEGMLHVKTVRSEKVRESVGEAGSWAKGELSEVEVVGGGLKVSGWAFDGESRGPVRAVAISYQAGDGEETWLGIAGRNTVQRKKAEKAGARVLEDRIGWIYEPLTGEERAFISGTRLKLKRREVPTGWVTIRAYGYDPVGGRFAPLTGSLEVELPVK